MGRRPVGRTWTQAPSNLPPHPSVRHGNRALQPGFRRTFSPNAPRIGPYNPGARAPLFPERRWYSRPHLSSPLWRGTFRVIWALRPQRPLSTGIFVPGARAPPLALTAGGIYAPISATLLPFYPWGRLGFTTPARHPHNRYSCTAVLDLSPPARTVPCTYSPP